MTISVSPRDWATAVKVTQRMITPKMVEIPTIPHPSAIAEVGAGAMRLQAPPTEVFSNEKPIFTPEDPDDDDLLPIDILFGQYDRRRLRITIYIDNIELYAKPRLNCEADDLLYLVRLHEYAHSLVHQGVPRWVEGNELRRLNNSGETDWSSHRRRRACLASRLGEDTHEFLAQAISWSGLKGLPRRQESKQIKSAFLDLMRHQHQRYRLSRRELGKSNAQSIALVLGAMIYKIGPVLPNPKDSREHVSALLCR